MGPIFLLEIKFKRKERRRRIKGAGKKSDQ
jgi:hypothetical protein